MSSVLPPDDRPLHVLLLEDSAFDAELLQETLLAVYPRAVVDWVTHAAAFAEALARGGHEVILSDHQLPSFGGAEALDMARNKAPRVPFIFVSGVIGEDNAVELLKRGATDYVSKSRLSRLPVVLERALREVDERAARDRAEGRLREAHLTFDRVVDALRDYAVILLDPLGRITQWSRAAQEVFGYRPQDVLGRSVAVLHTAEDRTAGALDRTLRRAVADGKAATQRWMVRRDGSQLWAESTLSPLFSAGGELAGFCKIARDTTAEHQAAQALHAAKEQAEAARAEAERASLAKDRFLAVLSHELRTPLAPVTIATHILEKAATVPEKYSDLLPMIRRNVALEARLIDDLLDLAAITSGKLGLKPAPVDMHALLRQVLDMVADQIGQRQLRLELDLAAGPAVVRVDGARMQQVLSNLLRNAIKFSNPGGLVEVRTRLQDGLLTLTCRDEGMGIEPAALRRIFTAFEQADREVAHRLGGLGLGLAIARHLVTEHGGELTAHSDGRGQGATFTLTLRCTSIEDVPALTGSPHPPVPAAARAGTRLLLVEDNVDAAETLALCLEEYGYAVDHAGTCADALHLAATRAFDIVLTDLGLPDGTGVDIGRSLSPTLPVVALSGYGAASDRRRTSAAGFSGHLVKPAEPEEVHALLQQVLGHREQVA